PIQRKIEKSSWSNFKKKLDIYREKTTGEVLKIVFDTGLVPIPPKVEIAYKKYQVDSSSEYSGVLVKEIMELPYKQFLSAITFLHPETEFSTEHGVKGEEYDNVIFVISKGWNQYQFDVYAPMLLNGKIPPDKQSSFERNRNLFYVCCSRPVKRLYILVTFPVDTNFEIFLKELVGESNYFNYEEFISTKN
ncbi:MAG: UvrD-helicase domain-containing protein, partial [Lachnospiraceae bacterium]